MNDSNKERQYTEKDRDLAKKKNIGKAIKNSRSAHRLTVDQLSDILHITPTNIQQFERGYFHEQQMNEIRTVLTYFDNEYLLMNW